MDSSAMRAHLQAAISAAGRAVDFCRKHDLSEPYVSEVLNGKKAPGDKILAALGLERVVTYRKIEHSTEEENHGEAAQGR